MNSPHIGTASELCWFAMEMAKELESHQDEKKPLRYVDCNKVKTIVADEIRKRLDIIDKLDVENIDDLKEITKQYTHIGNYSLMGFVRGKYNV